MVDRQLVGASSDEVAVLAVEGAGGCMRDARKGEVCSVKV